jgi:hypothetical protein
MASIIGLAALGALLVWFLGIGRRPPIVAPEDDLETPIELDELEEAEREIRDDPDAQAAADAMVDDDDDWGPGSGSSMLPGIT